MNRIRPKQPRLRLDPESYEQLCEEVLQRDSWRCQACGTTSNLEVHHQQHRSQSGEPLCIFMYNPFGPKVLKEVIGHLAEESLVVYVASQHPVALPAIRSGPAFRVYQT
jgi:5-methylcytosine-specific restriction endonuclease McrA